MIEHTRFTKSLLAFLTLALTTGVGVSGGLAGTAKDPDHKNVPPTVKRDVGYDVLLPGDRIISGTVTAVGGGEVEVNIGELMPRYLSLDRAHEKGLTLEKGDKLEIAVNDQNLVVDYHPINHPAWHRIIEGKLAQPLVVGQDWAVVRTEEKELAIQVRPLARSKLSAIPVNKNAIFLIDQTGKIIDSTIGTEQALHETARTWAASPPKAVYRRVSGTLVEPATWITLRTKDGKTQRYRVMPSAQRDLQSLSEGTSVILLLDEKDRVMDVASSQKETG